MSSAEALSQQRCRGGGGCDGSWKLHQNHDKSIQTVIFFLTAFSSWKKQRKNIKLTRWQQGAVGTGSLNRFGMQFGSIHRKDTSEVVLSARAEGWGSGGPSGGAAAGQAIGVRVGVPPPLPGTSPGTAALA